MHHKFVTQEKNNNNKIFFFFLFLFLRLYASRSKVFQNLDAGATYIDSDTGLESMSSADATTKACSLCLEGAGGGGNNGGSGGNGGHNLISNGDNVSGGRMGSMMPTNAAIIAAGETMQQIEGLRNEITKLKCDKLDLLRQNVVSSNF